MQRTTRADPTRVHPTTKAPQVYRLPGLAFRLGYGGTVPPSVGDLLRVWYSRFVICPCGLLCAPLRAFKAIQIYLYTLNPLRPSWGVSGGFCEDIRKPRQAVTCPGLWFICGG